MDREVTELCREARAKPQRRVNEVGGGAPSAALALASMIGNRVVGRLVAQSAGTGVPQRLMRYGHERSCTQEDLEKRIWPADHLARQIVDKTLEVLARDKPPAYLSRMLKEFFGTEMADLAEIRRNFAGLRKKFSDNDYMYSCAHDCKDDKETKTMGRTDVGRIRGPSGPLILCMNTLSTQINPVRLTAQTIIHEMGHRYLAGFTGDKYCDSDCSAMPPSEALKNTDSYASLALAVWDKEFIIDLKARKAAEQGGKP